MARTTGTFDFSANFEVNKTAPLDARLTVEDKSELTGLPFAYIGMVVAVTSDSTATNNGVYVLDDTDGTTLSNWKLVGANSGSFSGSFEGDGSGLTGIISDDATKAQTVETIATTNDDEHFLTFVDSNNGTAAAEIVYTTDGIKVAPGTSTIIAGIVSANSFSGSFSGSFEGDGSGLTGVVAAVDIDALTAGTTLHQTQDSFIFSDNGTEKKITFSNLEDAIFSNITGDATVAAGGELTIANSLGDIDSTSFTGSFSGSFIGDGSGLTGVAPTAGDGILVNGTTVSVDSGSLIQTATNNSAYNVLFNNSTTPFAIDNTTSHFSYNPGLNQLRVSGSIELGSDDGSGYSPEIRFKVSGSDPSGRMVVFEKQNGVEFASIEIDNNFDLVNVLDPDGKRGVEQSFLWRTSGSAADGLVTRMELTGDSGDLTVYGIISGSSLETSGQVTIGTINSADGETVSALFEESGVVKKKNLGNVALQDTGSMTVLQADTATTATTAATASYVSAANIDGVVVSAINATTATNALTASTATVTKRDANIQSHHIVFSLTTGSNEELYADKGLKYIPATDGLTVGSVTGSFKGDLDGSATNINVATDGGNAEHFVIFTDAGSGNQQPKSDAGLKYNPSTNILTTTVTQANNATTATNIALSTSDTDQAFNLIFTEAGDESGAMLVDSDYQITYNPNTDTLSVGGGLSVGGTATVTGDLIVNGTTTTISTENLEVEDSFILLSSGSSATGDSGIIFGGSRGTAGQGNALFWDASYNSNQGRLGVTGPITSDTSSPISNPDLQYYVAGVFVGTEGDASANNAAHQGNIRIESNEIYIYV
jgi:hypothetical protein